MSSIKLTADSGGGTFEVKAPASSGNTRVLTLPDAANGTVLTTTNPKAGNIIQVVQVKKTDKFSTGSSSFVDVTGLTVDITPQSTSNKILVRAVVSCGAGGGGIDNKMRLLRGSTAITNEQFVRQDGSQENYTWVLEELDSPNSTSATTYKIQVLASSNDVFVNRDGSNELLGQSTITAMEVAV